MKMKIIGQRNNIAIIKQLNNNKLPRFMLLVGGINTGKKYFIEYIVREVMKKQYQIIGKSIDDIRELNSNSYQLKNDFVYCLFDLQDYNYRSLEAILKISEDTPNNAIIIASVDNIYKLKDTIKNRAYILYQNTYNTDELKEYTIEKKYKEFLYKKYDCINTPTLIDFYNTNINKYEQAALKFIKYINKVSAGNAFKAATNLAELDFDKFLLILNEILLKNIDRDKYKVIYGITELIYDYIQKYNIKGINKISLIKSFILNYRGIGLKYEFRGI